MLEQKYGPIHAIVLRHDDEIREALLADAEGVSRTHALTFLSYDKNNEEICNIDKVIREGGLIGKTFRDHGYTIKKNVIKVFIMELTPELQKEFQTDEAGAKARITEFYAKKEGQDPLIYGTVLEIYSPDFKDPKDGINEVDLAQVNPTTEALKEVGVPVEDIWSRLDRAAEPDEWADIDGRLDKAVELCRPTLESFERRIKEHFTPSNQ